jgi:hypothetical protein
MDIARLYRIFAVFLILLITKFMPTISNIYDALNVQFLDASGENSAVIAVLLLSGSSVLSCSGGQYLPQRDMAAAEIYSNMKNI